MSVGPTRIAVVYNAPTLGAGHPDSASEGDVVGGRRGRRPTPSASRGSPRTPVAAASAAVGEPGARAGGRRRGRTSSSTSLEGFGGAQRRRGVPHGALLELLGLPYTGSTVEALAVCQSKGRTKALLRGHGLPTAASVLVKPGAAIPLTSWTGPAVVKPDSEDGSLGIDQGSVVADHAGLCERVERLRASYGGSVLIEPYLDGPEYNVGVLALPDPQALPVSQVMFRPAEGEWPILTYAAKWDAGSAEDLASPVVCPAEVDPDLAGHLARIAVGAFRATGCRDYARVDFRLDPRGEPMILEVNPNPDIGPRPAGRWPWPRRECPTPRPSPRSSARRSTGLQGVDRAAEDGWGSRRGGAGLRWRPMERRRNRRGPACCSGSRTSSGRTATATGATSPRSRPCSSRHSHTSPTSPTTSSGS